MQHATTASGAGRYRRVHRCTPLRFGPFASNRLPPSTAQYCPVLPGATQCERRRPRRDAGSAHRCQQALLHGCTHSLHVALVSSHGLFVCCEVIRRCSSVRAVARLPTAAAMVVCHAMRHGVLVPAADFPTASCSAPLAAATATLQPFIASAGVAQQCDRPGGLAAACRRTAHQWRICGREYGGVWRMLRCSISTSPTQRSFRSARCTTGESTRTRSARADARMSRAARGAAYHRATCSPTRGTAGAVRLSDSVGGWRFRV
jgi:hypothetical protein